MHIKMESEHSYSEGSSASSNSSSGSTAGDEEVMEPVRIMGQSLELPQELCEDYSLFKEFFSIKTWETLDEKHKDHLKNLLPKFPEEEEEEKEKTIKMLFNLEPFHFTSPLVDFYNNLKHGNYRPDIAKMRKFLKKARRKQQRHKLKSYYAKLLPEVLISRERVLASVKGAPPGHLPYIPALPPKPSKNNYKPLYLRARQRYFEELAAIQSEVGGEESEDDNYPEGPPDQLKKHKQMSVQNADSSVSGTLSGADPSHPTSLQCLKNVLGAHRIRRQLRETHPELNTVGISLEDIKQRVALVNGAKKLMFGGQKSESPIQKLKRGSKKESSQKSIKTYDSKQALKKPKEEDFIMDDKSLLPNIKVKQEETDSESSSFVDPITSPKRLKKLIDSTEVKQEVVDIKYPDITNINYSEPKLESVIKQEPLEPSNAIHNMRICQPVPIKLEDLDGIDMMALPVELADDTGELPIATSEIKEETNLDPDEPLTETTHANFLSLVRALFPARAAHRASKQQLHSRCEAVMRSPIAPLNTWYSLCDDWCAELDSALDFLAGERGPHPDDFVPYLQYITDTQMYQWIGAGRDCDAILGRLCERWLRSTSPAPPLPGADPPPPRYTTSWVVRPPSSTEIAEFRAQERRRFSSAAKPFTYVQHGYRSIVGPCARLSIGSSGHSTVLSVERPRHATLLALVRDAAARMPNGQGTRRDLLTLLKMSQWIAPCSDQTLNSAVSTALDRLSSMKRDPVVKYDARTSIWTYLHRNRTEEDWMKSIPGRGRGVKAAVVTPATPLRDRQNASSPDMDLEVASVEEVIDDASDTDVDVDDSSLSSIEPQLSSAQLLIQATQAKHLKQTTHVIKKPKPKVMVSPPQKTKLTGQIKQPLMAQSTKLPNIQSIKQPNIISQTKKSVIPLTKQMSSIAQTVKPNVSLAQTVKEINVAQLTNQADISNLKQNIIKSNVTQINKSNNPLQVKPSVNQAVKLSVAQTVKQVTQPVKQIVTQPPRQTLVKQSFPVQGVKQAGASVTQVPKSSPSIVALPQKSPLLKQRPLLKTETSVTTISTLVPSQQNLFTAVNLPSSVQATSTVSVHQNQNKIQATRSLLIRPSTVQTTAAAVVSNAQSLPNARRGVVRVLSPATPSSGKSLISPQALMHQDSSSVKKRSSLPNLATVTTSAQISSSVTVVSSVPTVATSSVTTRTVQLGGRTVQLATNQTVHLPGGQAVQITPGHTLQLSSLQLPTHSVRLPSGQTVQLASPQTVRAVSTTPVRNQPSPTVKSNAQTTQNLPVSAVQLSGQTVQIGGQTVQLGGQSVQLTGHTVKLPSGQSVQVASQNVLPSQSMQNIQLPSGNMQTVQLGGQSVQLSSGQSVQLSGQSVQLPSGQSVQLGGQTVQIGGQTVQLAGGQTVQLPSGQRLHLASGQTVQLPSGQTLQLASGQTVQLANQQVKSVSQVIRTQSPAEKPTQPIVAKLLTNAQGGMISLESLVGNRGVHGADIQVAGVRPRANVRLISPATRLARPLLLTSKPLHNIILQQSDGSAIRVTSAGGSAPTQAIVLSNIGAQTVTTSTSTAPVLKLQQVTPIQHVKLPQAIKIQQAGTSGTGAASSGVNTVRSVVMDGQQLKLVGGRHVLARLLRPANQPQ